MAMELQTIHCFLVHPAKQEAEQPSIGGALVPKRGNLFHMLKGIFDEAEDECQIEISFNANSDGEQQNDCRDLIIEYLKSQHIDDGRNIALRLQGVTNMKSGLGLLFLMFGQEDGHKKLVVSRFPANQGILAEEQKDKLTVEFLEKVFMKSATAYKSAVYVGKLTESEFWTGRAVDKQINYQQLANYWIRAFLLSELRTTGAAGSRRLALALREAMHCVTDPNVKAEFAAAATLAGSVAGQTLSANEFCGRFGLSKIATDAVTRAFKHETFMAEHFQFDIEEFKQHITFRSIELNNGGMLTAEASKFDNVFKQEKVDQGDNEVRFTTQGKIVDQRLRKSK
jgi:hypothetical protein